MLKKIVLVLSISSMILIAWGKSGSAEILSYLFEGSFDSGPLVGQSFSGMLQYDTGGDPHGQSNESEVIVGGSTYSDLASGIQANTTPSKLRVAGFTSVGSSDFVLWELNIFFDVPITLAAPLPLESIADSLLQYADTRNSFDISSGRLNMLDLPPVDDFICRRPIYKKGTYWGLERYGGSQKLSFEIIRKTKYEGQRVYEARVNDNITTYLTRDNLEIIDLKQDGVTVNMEVKLLDFPLYLGKKWESTWKIQEFPTSPTSYYNVAFEVVDIKPYNYVIDKELHVEERAYKIHMDIAEYGSGEYYYVPSSQKFPGTNIFAIFQDGEEFLLREYGVNKYK